MSISWFIYFTQQLLLASLQIGVDLGLGRRITLSKLKIWTSSVYLRQIGISKSLRFWKLLKIVMIYSFQGFENNKLTEINWYFLSNSCFGKYFGK